MDSAERRRLGQASGWWTEKQELFRALVIATSEVVYRMSPDWRQMRYLCGKDFIADTESTSETWLERYIFLEDQDRVIAAIREAIRTKSVFELEHRVRRVDGSAGWIFSRALPVCDDSGEIVEWFGMASDITARKQAEASLRASEAKLAAAIESMTDAVLISDAEGRFVDFNQALAGFHRFRNKADCPRTLAEYSDILDVFLPTGELAPLETWAVPRALRGETGAGAEYTFRRKDTGETWVGSYSFAPIRDQDGTIIGSVVTGRDITDQKRIQEALLAREKEFRRAFELAITGVIISDMRGRVLQANSAFCRLVGYTERQLQKMDFRELIHSDDRPKTLQLCSQLLKGKLQSFEIESRYCTQSGAPVWVHISVSQLLDLSEKPANFIVLVTDITRRKQAEAELAESEARYRRLFEDDLTGDFVAAPDGKIQFCNAAFARIYGFADKNAAAGSSIASRKARPEDWPKLLRRLRRHRIVERFESEHRRLDGTPIHVMENLVGISDANGRLRQIQGYVFDDTERKQSQLRLAASLEELRRTQAKLVRQERLATLGKLAGSVAHEMRTPLSVIRTNMFFLQQRYPTADQEVREALEETTRAIASADEIICEMLDYVRDASPCDSVFAVNDAVAQALRLVSLPAAIHLRASHRIDTAEPSVQGCQDHVIRILVNLIQNSVQAMPDGGELEIATHSDEPGSITIAVRDTGCGIPPENLGRIFEPLFSTKTMGIGLGLAIAKRYAELNGGELSVESQPGRGTTFRLHLKSAHRQEPNPV